MYAGAFWWPRNHSTKRGDKMLNCFFDRSLDDIHNILIDWWWMLLWCLDLLFSPDIGSRKKQTVHYDSLDLQHNKASMHISVLLKMNRSNPANI